MTVLLPALAVAFAAFFVWLIVRIFNRRERWAKWTTAGVVIGLPVLYILSVGPAIAGSRRERTGWETVQALYRPIFAIAAHHPPSHGLLCRYVHRCGVSKRDFPVLTKSGGVIWISD